MKKFVIVAALAFSLSPLAYAKEKEQPTAQPTAQPQITEVEKLTIENIQLKATPLQAQLKALRDQFDAVMSQIEAEHPGFTYDGNRLVPKPTAPVQPAPAPVTQK